MRCVLLSVSRDFEIELLAEGNKITFDLYFGVIKSGDENTQEITMAEKVMIKRLKRHL